MRLPKSLTEFKTFLEQPKPSGSCPIALQAFKWDAKGNWEAAQDLIDRNGVAKGSWVPAYLHRKEGEERNAR
ncbi:MAG: hypothetical protein AAF717_03245 [Bacteroidota bacterium]